MLTGQLVSAPPTSRRLLARAVRPRGSLSVGAPLLRARTSPLLLEAHLHLEGNCSPQWRTSPNWDLSTCTSPKSRACKHSQSQRAASPTAGAGRRCSRVPPLHGPTAATPALPGRVGRQDGRHHPSAPTRSALPGGRRSWHCKAHHSHPIR